MVAGVQGVALVEHEPTEPAEEARLRALRETGVLDRAVPPEFEAILDEALDRFGVPIALITFMEAERQVIVARRGTDLRDQPRRDAFCDRTIQADDVLSIPDLREDEQFSGSRLVGSEPFLRFYAGAPLVYLRGVRIGTLCLLDVRPREFSLGDRAELEAMAEEVVAAIARREFDATPGGMAS